VVQTAAAKASQAARDSFKFIKEMLALVLSRSPSALTLYWIILRSSSPFPLNFTTHMTVKIELPGRGEIAWVACCRFGTISKKKLVVASQSLVVSRLMASGFLEFFPSYVKPRSLAISIFILTLHIFQYVLL
jgi:hypothetical protein